MSSEDNLQPPGDLADDVAEVWRSTVHELDELGLAYSSDTDTLRCYCEAVIGHRKASALLARSPILIKGLHGNMVRNPALQIQRDYAMTIRAFAHEFGLTPSARVGLVSDEEEEIEPVEEETIVDKPTQIVSLDEIERRRNARKFGT